MGAVSTKVAVIVGDNARSISGKETENIRALGIVCEVKKIKILVISTKSL